MTFSFKSSSFSYVLNSYNLNSISASVDTFNDNVSSEAVLNRLNLVRGLTDMVPENSRYASLNTLRFATETGLEDAFDEEQTTLSSFFASQLIDVPRSFLQSKSLFTVTARLPKQKLINLLMRHGLRLRTIKTYSFALTRLSFNADLSVSQEVQVRSWKFFYTALTSKQLVPSSSHLSFIERRGTNSVYRSPTNSLFSDARYTLIKKDPSQLVLFDQLAEFIPLFSFFIKKVDKSKRKHSRGKSGKYQVIWKYVPRYKRLLVVLRWLSKDIRFQRLRTFSQRIISSLQLFLSDPSSHLVPQLRQFVHNFVFTNFKKNLLKTLKAAS